MLYEFALHPDLFEEALTATDTLPQISLRQLLHDLIENGMLVDLRDGEWQRYVNSLLLSPQGKCLGDIKAQIGLLHDRNRIVVHAATVAEPVVNWLTEALEAKKKCDFDGVIVSQATYGRLLPPFPYVHPLPLPGEDASASQSVLNRDVMNSKADLQPVLAPILRHATKLNLIDPFFSCWKVCCRDFLELCIDLLRTPPGVRPLVRLHVGDPLHDRENPESFENRAGAWKRYLQRLRRTHDVSICVHFWKSKLPLKVHNRYLVTDQKVCIKAGDSFECHDADSAFKDEWMLLDYTASINKLAEYAPNSHSFTSIGHPVMVL